jgi:predicted transcriptional regulator
MSETAHLTKTKSTIADIFGVTPATVQRWIKNNKEVDSVGYPAVVSLTEKTFNWLDNKAYKMRNSEKFTPQLWDQLRDEYEKSLEPAPTPLFDECDEPQEQDDFEEIAASDSAQSAVVADLREQVEKLQQQVLLLEEDCEETYEMSQTMCKLELENRNLKLLLHDYQHRVSVTCEELHKKKIE